MADRMPVGQVWIRVSPDTRGFARETKRELQKMKSLDRYKVPIEVEVDTEKVEDDFAKAVGNLQKQAATKDYRVKIQTELAWRQGAYRKQIRGQVEKYQTLANDQQVEIKTNLSSDGGDSPYAPKINLAVDDKRFERDVKRLMEETKAELKVSLDKKTIKEEAKEAVDEVSTFLGRLMKREENKLQIQVEARKLEEAQENLARIAHTYDGMSEDLAAARKELNRVNNTYDRIRHKVNQTEFAMEKVNLRTEEGAKAYEALAKRLGALNRQLQVYGDERKRLMERGREDFLAVNMNMDSMREAEERVEELRERIDEIASEIEVGLDHTSVAAVSAELFALVRPRVINIYTKMVNTARWQRFWNQANEGAKNIANSLTTYATQLIGLRLLYRTAADILRIIPKLDMMIPALAAGSVAAVSAISAASTLLGSVLSIGADLMRVFNLALMLPSVLAGLTGSVLIMGRALKDFENRFPEIISYWKKLGDTVSDRVWSRAADNVRGLHRALVPILNAGVPAWASAWGDSMGAFADGLKSAVGSGHLKEFFDNSIKGTKAAEKGWESLGSALLRMVGIGSRFFPQLGSWFSDTMGSFEDWVKKNDKNGNFERWIKDGIRAFKDLGRVIKATGSMLHSLATAARSAGLPSLTEFADGMTALADKMRSPQFQDALVGPLENMLGMMRDLNSLAPLLNESLGTLWELAGQAALSLSGPLTGALESILTAFNSGEFQGNMSTFFEDIGTFIEEITPGLGVLVREFGRMARVVGVAAREWGPAFNELILLLEDFGGGLHSGMESFLEGTGPALKKMLEDLRPAVKGFGDAIGDLLADESFQEFARYMIDALGDIAGLALRAGTALLYSFKEFAAWWDTQPEWFKELSTNLLAITLTLPALSLAFAGLKRVLMPAIVAIRLVAGAFRGLGGALRGIGGALLASGLAKGGIRGLLMRVLGRFLLLGGGPLGWVALIASLVPADIGARIADAIAKALFPGTFVEDLTHHIKKRLHEEFGGKTIFGIMWDGIKEMAGAPNSWSGAGQFFGGLFKFLFPQLAIAWTLGKAVAEWIIETFQIDSFAPMIRALLNEQISHMAMTLWASIINYLDAGWETIKKNLEDWEPKSIFGSAVKWIYNKWIKPFIDWILGGLGIGGGASGSGGSAGGGAGSDAASSLSGALGANSTLTNSLWSAIDDALNAGWNDLINRILGWNPLKVFNILSWIGKNLWRWLTGGGIGDTFTTITGTLGSWAQDAWEGSIKPWLESGWSGLVARIKGWFPTTVFNILSWIGKNLWRWLSEGGIGDAFTTITGTLGNWGQEAWEGSVKPWLESGWKTLKDNIGRWNPAKAGTIVIGGGGSLIDRAIGTDPASTAGTEERLRGLGSGVATFGSKVASEYGKMGDGSRREIKGLADNTDAEFGRMEKSGTSKSSNMGSKVGSNLASMASSALSRVSKMRSGTSSDFSSMQSTAASKASTMQAQVVARMAAMQVGAGAKMAAMQASVIAKMGAMQISSVARARAMSVAFVAQMVAMSTRALAAASRMRSSLPRMLTINASGPGRSTGSTFVSGLSSGLSRARSAAYSIRGSIRSALSFSAYSSGATVGGTFASGIRSRVGAVLSAGYALARAARATLPNSPADEGPFSGSGWGGWGESIGEELAKGLRNAAPEVAREAELMMSGVHTALESRSEVGLGIAPARVERRGAFAAGAPAVSAGNNINVNVESRSDEPFEEAVRFARDLQFALEGVDIL